MEWEQAFSSGFRVCGGLFSDQSCPPSSPWPLAQNLLLAASLAKSAPLGGAHIRAQAEARRSGRLCR